MPPLAPPLELEPMLMNSIPSNIPKFSRNGSATTVGSSNWSVHQSAALYRVSGWGAPYFFINKHGHMGVRPHGINTKPIDEIDLSTIAGEAQRKGLSLPLLVRFPDILKDRLQSLVFAFKRGIKRQNYIGHFQGVFPVKCNPDRDLVEDILKHGKAYNFGLEAGSKPELLMAITSMLQTTSEAFLICNGYKDVEYVKLALLSRRLGINTIIVLEQEQELDIILEMSRRLNIMPVIGIRAKLTTKHEGHWGETSGERGKFGLSTSEIMSAVKKLRLHNMLETLQLLHFHIGSQIPSLEVVKEGVSEAALIFCELKIMGAGMKIIDIGGGLGVDYDGTNSAESEMSIGYNLEEYAEQVVVAIKEACALKNVPQPTVCCESGRALVSHYSVLLFDIFASTKVSGNSDFGVPLEYKGLPRDLQQFQDSFRQCTVNEDHEGALEYAKRLKFECTRLFRQGALSLEVRADMDSRFEVVSALVCEQERGRGVLSKSACDYSATYHMNLSIFKSMPDSWAIGQLFPIVPVHKLDEEPTVRAILSDITCDSDGKFTTFIGGEKHLKVHEIDAGESYIMGMFLGGAYQEVLGSMHNLFGTLNCVHVEAVKGPEEFRFVKTLPGQNLADVLRAMQHEPLQMFDDLQRHVERIFCDDMDDVEVEADCLLQHFDTSFQSYTYLSSCPHSLRNDLLERKRCVT